MCVCVCVCVCVNTKMYSVTGQPIQSSSRHVSSFKDETLTLISATEQLSDELLKSEVLLIASTLLVVKTENVYGNTREMQITMETELCL